MTDKLRKQIGKMSPRQRVDLICDIWSTILDKDAAAGVSDDELAMIDARLRASAADPRPSIGLSEFSQKLDGLKSKLVSRRRRRAS